MKVLLSSLIFSVLVMPTAHGENVRWSSDQFPIKEITDFSHLSPAGPTYTRLGAFQDASGSIAVMAPTGAPSREAKLSGEPVLTKNKELRFSLTAFQTTPATTGWHAVFIGLKNKSGERVGIIVNPDGFFPAQWSPEFRALKRIQEYSCPATVSFIRKDDQLIISVGGNHVITVNQPKDAPWEIPVLSASRQKVDEGILGVFSTAVIDTPIAPSN